MKFNKTKPYATAISQNHVVIYHANGQIENRVGGSVAWRNNNPGNLSGPFAESHGAIGRNGRFAIFENENAGDAASKDLLLSPKYINLTVDETIATRSPKIENNTASLQRDIRNLTGLSGNETIRSLNSSQLNNLLRAIKRTEGWVAGKITYGENRGREF